MADFILSTDHQPAAAGARSKVRPVSVDGEIAYVPLTRGFVAIIDAADAPAVGRFNWLAIPNRSGVYALRSERVDGVRRWVAMHRFIIDTPVGLETDHIDGDTLNNRRSNLRPATVAENQRNTGPRKDSKSGFKGVTRSCNGRWRARIKVNGRLLQVGTFDSVAEAAAAYCSAADKHHGPFTRKAA